MAKVSYQRDLLDLYEDPTDFFKKCLYLKITNHKNICTFKGKKINLSPRLFTALFMMAEGCTKTHQLDTIDRDNGAALDNERQIAARINKAFKETGFKENIVKKELRAGYCINLDVIQDEFIVTTRK